MHWCIEYPRLTPISLDHPFSLVALVHTKSFGALEEYESAQASQFTL